jgi:hypothetical protein
MTRRIRNRAATGAALLLALLAGTAVAAGSNETAETTTPKKSAIVIAGAAANDAQTIARAKATGQDVRVVHSLDEQLGATHMLAARHYGVVTTIGVDRRIAIAPVQEKFPGTRFVAAEAGRPGQR